MTTLSREGESSWGALSPQKKKSNKAFKSAQLISEEEMEEPSPYHLKLPADN